MNRREVTGETARTQIGFVTVQEIVGNILAFGSVEVADAVLLEEADELTKIGPISEAGIGSQTALDSQMIEKSIDQLLHRTTSLVASYYRRAFDVGEVCYLKGTK
jgi:hypothetical protein